MKYKDCINNGWRVYTQRYNDEHTVLCVQNPNNKEEQLQFLYKNKCNIDGFKAFLMKCDCDFKFDKLYVSDFPVIGEYNE